MAEVTEKSLYARLGGYDALAAATDDLLRRVTAIHRSVSIGGATAKIVCNETASWSSTFCVRRLGGQSSIEDAT